jgi:hypothetical protein
MFSVQCGECGKDRGIVYVDTKHDGPYGILFCPRCDYAHEYAAGPEIEHRARDANQEPRSL